MDDVFVISLFTALIFLLLLVGAPLKPLQWLGQAAIKVLTGALLLFFLNAFGTLFNLHIAINPITAAVAGFLGVPGLLSLAAMAYFIF